MRPRTELEQSSMGAIVFFVCALMGLSACQTTPATSAPATTSLPATPASAKPEETRASITPEGARNLASGCFTCHGPGGNSPGSIPSLAKLKAAEIAAKLKDFRSGTASSTVMSRHARAYTEAEIDAIANYIAGSKR